MPMQTDYSSPSLGSAYTDSWVQSNGYGIPAGRLSRNGAPLTLITALRTFASGRGATRNIALDLVGLGGTGGFDVGSSGSAQDTGFRACNILTYGGSMSFRISITTGSSQQFYFGRGGGGTNTVNIDGATWSGTIFLSLLWSQSPTAPSAPTLTPGSTTMGVGWSIPGSYGDGGDDGGQPIIGYRVWYWKSGQATDAQALDVAGNVSSATLTGLDPASTYFVRVSAKNAVTEQGADFGPAGGYTSAVTGGVPGAPTSVAATAGAGYVNATWATPATDGGVTIDSYLVDISTDAGFATYTRATVGAAVRAKTFTTITPGTTHYVRVYSHNAIGNSVASASANATPPARTALDTVKAAAVSVAGHHVSVRSDGASAPALTLGYIPFGSGGAFTTIAALPVGAGAGQFAVAGGERNLAVTADAAGNIYVIGLAGSNENTVLVLRYERTAATTWVLNGTLSQAMPSTGDALRQFAAAYVPGSPSTILMLTRRAGTVGPGALSYATLDLAAIAASSGALFIAYGSDPTWLATPPGAAAFNSGVLDVALVSGSRVAILANGYAVVDVAAGLVTTVSKAAAGTTVTGTWARVIGINATTFVVLTINSGALAWTFYGTNGAVLGSGTYAGSNAQGGAFGAQWDAYYDRVANAVTVYYVADDSARKLESIDVSPVTYAATAAAVLSTTLGAASSTNDVLRIAEGGPDERRIVVETANLLAGVKSTAAYNDLTGNVAPSAPTVTDIVGFDATNAQVLAWVFGDSNSLDTQTAYQVQVQRVSDSVDVVDTGKIASTDSTRNVAGATLTNGVNYRWRVRTYDVLDAAGAWSAYDTFATAATGTLTITTPAADNPAGLDVSSLNVIWSYVQANGYTQTQRRVRVLNHATGAVLSDTTMQASTVGNYTVSALPSGVQVRIEVSIVTNAPGTPTIGPVTRLLTTNYGTPMTPYVVLSTGATYIAVQVTNPTPTGSRPAVVTNIVERRDIGVGEFVVVGTAEPNDTFYDYAVASGHGYDYRVRGVTA